jgi:hypothetical protein
VIAGTADWSADEADANAWAMAPEGRLDHA